MCGVTYPLCGTSMLKFKIDPPNGLELCCPAEAGGAARTLGQECGQYKSNRGPSPPGQPKVLVLFQGFNELLGIRAIDSIESATCGAALSGEGSDRFRAWRILVPSLPPLTSAAVLPDRSDALALP